MDILKTVRLRWTPQFRPATPEQIRNAAGGYTFAVDDWARLRRFLTLGTDGGTFYASDRELTYDNADVVFRLTVTDPIGLVDRIVEVSEAGRAPRQNAALFALAIAASGDDVNGRRAALAALPRVARTATALFLFVGYVEQFRGWAGHCVALWGSGIPTCRSIGWPTNWSSTGSGTAGLTATCSGWPARPE